MRVRCFQGMRAGKSIQWIFFIMLLCHSAYGQFTVSGKVVDGNTRDPLAFVNIIFNDNPLTGTVTDIKGNFSYSSAIIERLTFSYVGYETLTISLDTMDGRKPLLITLHGSVYSFKEVVVKAGENPANRIIRNAIENRKINNPENISSFRYKSYNKVIYDFDYGASQDAIDIHQEMDSVFKGGHLMVMESVTERKYIQPDNSEETILGVKVSGFRSPSFAPLATDLQPFSFYREIIPIIDINYLNPISNGSLSKYDFAIEDTLYQGTDTTFIISFKPQPGKNFDALTGLLYINTNKFAIQNVIAQPYEKGFIDIRIQQQYTFVDDRQWFPEQLKFEMFIQQNPSMIVGVRVRGTSEIRDVQLSADLDKKDFALEAISMDELANKRDSVFWTTYRVDSLSERERTTYKVMDSLGTKYKFDAILKVTEKLALSRVPVSWIDFDISKILAYNKYEGIRLGLGAYTNEKLMEHLSVGGFFGYGFKDHEWKYGGEMIASMDKNKEFEIRGRYQNNLLEVGKSRLGYFSKAQFDWRTFLAERMDNIEQGTFAIGFRALRYARLNVSLNHTRVLPQYAYEFQAGDDAPVINYTNSDITVLLRYAFKEKLISSMGQRISMGTRYPVFSFAYSRGFKDAFNSDFRYNKVEARLEQSYYFKNLGESKIRIEGGYIDHSLPYGLLYTGEGSYVQNWSVLVKNSFQTVKPYEFLSDRYVDIHYSHNFGSLLLQIGKWKPGFTVYQNIGWGSLASPENHHLISFKTKEKGLYESGLQIDNIIRFNYLNVAYMGFGAGAYYRYGPYAYHSALDNLAFTLSVTYTTK